MPTDMQVINEAPNRFLTRDYLLHVLGSEAEADAWVRRQVVLGTILARDGGWVRNATATPEQARAGKVRRGDKILEPWWRPMANGGYTSS